MKSPGTDSDGFIEPSEYNPIEPVNLYQDDEVNDLEDQFRGVGFVSTKPTTPVDFEDALRFYRHAAAHPPFNLEGMCQKIARSSYNVPALNGSAWIQWLTTSPENKHHTSDFSKVPLGAFMITKGSNPAGHIFLAGRPFASGIEAGWSNDLVAMGHVNKVSRNAPQDVWGHTNIGYITEINGYVLDLTHGAPPKPVENKRYKRIARTISLLEQVLADERETKDFKEAQLVRAELARLKVLYGKVKHT